MLLLTNYITMIKNEVWKKLLGYDPSPEQKREILRIVEEKKISLAEACSYMAMPPLYLKDEPTEGYDNPFRPAIRIVERNTETK